MTEENVNRFRTSLSNRGLGWLQKKSNKHVALFAPAYSFTSGCIIINNIGIDNSVGLGEVDDNDNNNDNGPRHRHGLLFVQVCDVG